jgi:2-methylcitrate dehydratase PrpD
VPSVHGGLLAHVGDFVADVRWDQLPTRVRDRTLVRLLDGLAVAFAGYDSPVGASSSRLARLGRLGSGQATYWLTGEQGPAAACAFVNTAAMQSILLLDGGLGGHPGSHIVPAAVAAAEAAEGTGQDLLDAIVAGYEVQTRFDTGQLRIAPQRHGLRGTPILGCFGAAAAAARATSLDGELSTTALAYAASLAFPVIWEPVLGLKTDERSAQNAGNTLNGVLAAHLAEAGFLGSPTALEGEGGLYAAWLDGDEEHPDLLTGLGDAWVSEDTFIHAYPTGGGSLGPIYCAVEIAKRYAPRVADIEAVEVKRFNWRKNSAYVDRGPFTTVESAIVSTYFGVACGLVHGGDWPAMRRGLGDPVVDALAQKIDVTADPTLSHFMESSVAVTLTDGTSVSVDSRDMPEVLLKPTWAQMVQRLAAVVPVLSDPVRAELVAAVEALPEAADLARLRRAMQACAREVSA